MRRLNMVESKDANEDVKMKIFFVELRRMEDAKTCVLSRFITRTNNAGEVKDIKEPLRTQVKLWWKRKMVSKELPLYYIGFERKDVVWSSIDEYSLPVKFCRNFEKSDAKSLQEFMMKHIFADEVREVSEERLEKEVERWKLLSVL
jgi:hypothetical protein